MQRLAKLRNRRTRPHFKAGRAFSTLALCAIITGGCAPHRIATTFEGLEKNLKPGRTVYVTTASGEVLEGKLEHVSGANAAVNVSGRTVPVLERDTVRIAVPEPLWQGVVIGAASGAALGGFAQGMGEVADMCGLGAALSGSPPPDCGSHVPRSMLIGAGIGAVIGAGLDALMWKRTTVFATPEAGTGTRVGLSPIADRRRVGLRVMVEF